MSGGASGGYGKGRKHRSALGKVAASHNPWSRIVGSWARRYHISPMKAISMYHRQMRQEYDGWRQDNRTYETYAEIIKQHKRDRLQYRMPGAPEPYDIAEPEAANQEMDEGKGRGRGGRYVRRYYGRGLMY